jgi:hypothetical protein
VKKPIFADPHSLDEDSRIQAIGRAVIDGGKTVCFAVDPENAERYISKLMRKFPGVEIIGTFKGLVPGTVTVKVGPPAKPETN